MASPPRRDAFKPSVPFAATFNPDAAFQFQKSGGLDAFPFAPTKPLVAPRDEGPVPVGISAATGRVHVNGFEFDLDDAQSALDSREHLLKPEQGPLPAGFRPLQPEEYKSLIEQIQDPSFGRIISANIGIGIDVSQLLAGGFLSFLGAEKTGQAIIDQQAKDLRKNQPFQRAFTDIDSPISAVEWFIANAAQMAPLVIEGAAISALGAVTGGTILAPTLAGVGGTALKLAGRRALTKRALAAARARAAGKPITSKAAKDLTKVSKVLRSQLKKQGSAGGAAVGGLAFSETVALGDITSEQLEANDGLLNAGDRAVAFLASIPYAFAELAPIAAGLNRALRGAKLAGAATRGQKLKRGARAAVTGAAVGGATEGFAEGSQEVLVLAASGQLDLSDPEQQNRLINAIAAGVGVGAPLGGGANILGSRLSEDGPTNLIVDPQGPQNTQLELPLDEAEQRSPQLRKGQVQGELFADARERDQRNEAVAALDEAERAEGVLLDQSLEQEPDPENIARLGQAGETSNLLAAELLTGGPADILQPGQGELFSDDEAERQGELDFTPEVPFPDVGPAQGELLPGGQGELFPDANLAERRASGDPADPRQGSFPLPAPGVEETINRGQGRDTATAQAFAAAQAQQQAQQAEEQAAQQQEEEAVRAARAAEFDQAEAVVQNTQFEEALQPQITFESRLSNGRIATTGPVSAQTALNFVDNKVQTRTNFSLCLTGSLK